MIKFINRLFHLAPAPHEFVIAAVANHTAFEAEHVARMEASAAADDKEGRNQFAMLVANRAVPLEGERKLIRRLGEYDRDQRVERIVGEVTRAYHQHGFSAPKNLRDLVEESV